MKRLTFLEYCLEIEKPQTQVKKALGITRKPIAIESAFDADNNKIEYTLFYPKNEIVETIIDANLIFY